MYSQDAEKAFAGKGWAKNSMSVEPCTWKGGFEDGFRECKRRILEWLMEVERGEGLLEIQGDFMTIDSFELDMLHRSLELK